jgi:hypothetical protein
MWPDHASEITQIYEGMAVYQLHDMATIFASREIQGMIFLT